MDKFDGIIGFSETKEVKPGVFMPCITEVEYVGDILRNYSRVNQNQINPDPIMNTSIEIYYDPYVASPNVTPVFVEMMGIKWAISSMELKFPKLVLTLGGAYNGK